MPTTTPGAGRIGIAYRSKLKYNVIGSVNFTNPATPILTGPLAPLQGPQWSTSATPINQTQASTNSGITLAVEDAGQARRFRIYQKVNDKFDFLADVSWTGWSKHPAAADQAQR